MFNAEHLILYLSDSLVINIELVPVISLQFLPLRAGARGVVPGRRRFLSRPHGQVPGHAAVSPLHPESQHSRELDGGVCSHPLRPGQHLPARGTAAARLAVFGLDQQ